MLGELLLNRCTYHYRYTSFVVGICQTVLGSRPILVIALVLPCPTSGRPAA